MKGCAWFRICGRAGLMIGTLLLLGTFGCRPEKGRSNDLNHPLFQKAEAARDEGNAEEAERWIRRFLEARPNSSAGHLFLAELYDEIMNQPLAAALHYEEARRLEPESLDAAHLEAWRDEAEKRYLTSNAEAIRAFLAEKEPAETLPLTMPLPDSENLVAPDTVLESPGVPGVPTGERALAQNSSGAIEEQLPEVGMPPAADSELQRELEALRVENTRLRTLKQQYEQALVAQTRELRTLRNQQLSPVVAAPQTPVLAERPAEPATPGAMRTYTVKSGDTPGSIARKFYGSSSKYKVIMDANRDLVTSDRGLKVGMTLKIPPQPSPGGE